MSVSVRSPAHGLRPPPAVVVLASAGPHRAAVARVARELGYRVVEAENPFEILGRLRAHPAMAQMLLVEVSLPGMDGGEVVERARDLSPTLRTGFLSDDPGGRDADLIRAYPEVLVVDLPADRAALVAVLRAGLGRSRVSAAVDDRVRSRGSGRFGPAGEITGPGRI